MDADDDTRIGVKVGPGFNWLAGSAFTRDNERFHPKVRAGLTTSLYVKSRLTDFFHLFDRRHNVANWFFTFEVGAAYRGGNFKYQVPSNGGWVTSAQDTAAFNRMPLFWVELPMYVSWDIGNKQKWEVFSGFKTSLRGAGELYRTNNISPYDARLDLTKWQLSGVGGVNYKGQIIGLQLMGNWGLTNVNKGLVIDQYLYNNYTPDPGTIRNTLKGSMKQYSIDLYILF